MRILIIPSWYPTPEKPVSGIFVREQADALSLEHEVRVLFLEVRKRGEKGKPRRRLSKSKGYIEELKEVPNLPFVWQFIYMWYMLRAYRSLTRSFKPDLIHCHVAVPAGFGAAMLRRLFGVPVVLTEHSSEFTSWLQRPGQRWMAQKALEAADLIIAVTEGQKQKIKTSFGRVSPVVVVSNMVDTRRFRVTPMPPTANGYRLIFVGLMETPQKGVPILLDAVSKICRDTDLSLLVDLVGDGALRSEYEAQAGDLRLEDIVTFHGLQPPEKIAEMLRESHALVLPSLRESQSLVVIEALASGRPVVSTRCGGPEYMINSTNGLIVEPGQPEPLAAAIIELLTHLDRYDPQRIAADAARLYGYAAITEALTAIYQGLGREL